MRIDHLTPADWVRVDPTRLQRFGRFVSRRIGRLIFRYKGYGRERIPSTGGFIIAPNHGSNFDGFFFAHGTPRTVRFMTKYQALEWPLIGRIIRWGGGYPVQPGTTGRQALDIARAILNSGHGLIMFMEGKLIRTPELGEPRSGLAVLALTTGVPVVPVAAWGNKPARVYGRRRRPWRFPRTTVVWGDPMTFPREDDPSEARVREVRDAIWAEVSRLHDQARELAALPDGRPRELPASSLTSTVAAEEQS